MIFVFLFSNFSRKNMNYLCKIKLIRREMPHLCALESDEQRRKTLKVITYNNFATRVHKKA